MDPTLIKAGRGIRRSLQKIGPTTKVDLRFLLTNPGIYSRDGDMFIYTKSDEYWYHIGYAKSRHGGVQKNYVNFQGSNVYFGLACLISNTAKEIYLPNREVPGELKRWTEPGVHRVLALLNNFKSQLFVDAIDAKRLSYEQGYPEGPQASLVVKQLHDDLVEDRPEPEPVDEELYELFKSNVVSNLVGDGFVSECGHTKKIGAATFDDLFTTLYHRLDMQKATYDSDLCLAVGVLPKIGQLTSDGKLRRIFPMSLGLQKTLELIMRDANNTQQYHRASVIKGAKFPRHKYTYDVVKCDRAMYAYVYKLCAEFPRLFDVLLPPIFTKKGVRYVSQFPSGLLCTSLINHCFVAAILEQIGTDGYIQGDGIMTAEPISHPLIRRCPDYTINGFDYSGTLPRYINGHCKLTSPRLTKGKPDGDKWELRREIYVRLLNADESTLPISPKDRPYRTLDQGQLTRAAQGKAVCNRLLRYYLGQNPNNNSWDCAPTETVTASGRMPLLRPSKVADEIRNLFR